MTLWVVVSFCHFRFVFARSEIKGFNKRTDHQPVSAQNLSKRPQFDARNHALRLQWIFELTHKR